MTLFTAIQEIHPETTSHAQRVQESATTPIINLMHLVLDQSMRFPLFENLVTGLDRKRFKQIICYLSGDPDQNNTVLEDAGHTVINLGMARKQLKHYRPSLAFRLSGIIKKHGVHVVHCQRHKPTVYGTAAAWLASDQVKVLTTVHGRRRTRSTSRKLLNRVLLKRVSRILAVSSAVRDDILKTNVTLSPDKVVTVYNGIDANRFNDTTWLPQKARQHLGLPPEGVLIFGTVGRLAPKKAQAVILKAYASIRASCGESLLVLAGTGALESELRRLAANLKIDRHVVFLGQRSDIPRVLRAYDIFLLPSLSEGHPLSVLEAMSSGLPVISTTIGGVQEIMADGSPGVMVTPSSVNELADAMQRMANLDEHERRAIGKRLRKRVLSDFTVDSMVTATTEQYLEVVKQLA